MDSNRIQGADDILRSLRRVAVPVMLLAAMLLVACGDSAKDECKDLCDGTQQEIDACRAACDAIR
jgi:hypothetical protein